MMPGSGDSDDCPFVEEYFISGSPVATNPQDITRGEKNSERSCEEENSCEPEECSLNEKAPRNTRNPMDCNSFYVCVLGQRFLIRCPIDQLFDEQLSLCVPSWDAKSSECSTCLTNKCTPSNMK